MPVNLAPSDFVGTKNRLESYSAIPQPIPRVIDSVIVYFTAPMVSKKLVSAILTSLKNALI